MERYRSLVKLCGGLVTGLGGTVLVGWLAGIDWVKSLQPGLATMKFNTALGFVLCGSALLLLLDPLAGSTRRRLGVACSVLAACLPLLTLAEYLSGSSLGVDQLFVQDTGPRPGSVVPGRMSGATAFCFLLFALALILQDVPIHRFRWPQILAIVGTVAGLIGTVGYLFGVDALYEFTPYSSMAVHTSVLFVILGHGVLLARPEREIVSVFTVAKVGGTLARRLFPWLLGAAILGGWLRLWGESTGHYATEVGTAFMVVGGILSFVVALWFGARSLNALQDRLEEENRVNARLAAIVASSQDAIIGMTLEGMITNWNDGARQLFGYAAGEMIGQSIERLIPPEREGEENEILSSIREGKRVRLLETVRLGKDGREIPVVITASPIKDSSGKVIGASKVVRDITERIQAEQIQERHAEELRRSNEDLEQFAYVASHDLQEPLRAVSGFLQLLENQTRGRLTPDDAELIRVSISGAQRMQSLIEGLLAFSRLSTRGGDFLEVSTEEAVDHALRNLSLALEESGAMVSRDALPMLRGDLAQLTMLFQNLIGNAIKFRGDEKPRIHIGSERVQDGWVISVSDNGVGIEERFFDRIFVIFQRLHTRRQFPGTGIGLSLCKKIVERHGGGISVVSELGAGSTFRCHFPESKVA